jgi:hypothetical protein
MISDTFRNNTIEKLIEVRFPSIRNFNVDSMSVSVTPVKYEDGHGYECNEYPPVATWRVGNTRYKYVLKPTFRSDVWRAFIFSGTTVRADYSSEEEKMWQILQWSVEGKTADEINQLLGNDVASWV